MKKKKEVIPIKTFVFVNRDGDSMIRIVWDNKNITLYTNSGNISLDYLYFLKFSSLIETIASNNRIILYNNIRASSNAEFKCVLRFQNEVYRPDSTKTRKRFLKHIQYMKHL